MHIHELLDLKDRIAIVTGGAGIYGVPISEALAEAGAHVIVASRNLDACGKTAAQLSARGLHATAERYDQAEEASILAFRDRVLRQFGSVDVLINNAVIRPMRRYDDPLEAWRRSMAVNATGVFAVTRAFLQPMKERKFGSIINIGSIQGVVAPRFDNYAGTDMTTPPDYHFHKHGIIGLTRYLAAWAGPYGVRVNAISPGGLETERTGEPFRSQYSRHVLLGRMAGHDDIKGAVVFLASDASAYVTGQNIVVDGGYTC